MINLKNAELDNNKKRIGKIIFVGTPIGNLGDMSIRALKAIKSVDILAVEDTRKLLILKKNFDLRNDIKNSQIFVYNQFNEHVCSLKLIKKVLEGYNIALLSNAGMPNISDPGYSLLKNAIKYKIHTTVIPGPCSISSALSISGLQTHKFCFEGFLPKKKKKKNNYMNNLISENRTMIFFESKYRLRNTLEIAQQVFGKYRKSVIIRELTKINEEIIRGTLSDLIIYTQSKCIKGEIILIIAGIDNKN